MVFVVAEQPTGGIIDTEFEHALQWMQALREDHTCEPLSILGPTFSGSLTSLARELEAKTIRESPSPLLVNTFGHYPYGIRIYSGSTSSEISVRWFQVFLAQQHEKLQKAGLNPQTWLQFRTFNESDSLMTDRFLCYLQHEGYQLSKVAILSEDETAFGREPGGSGNKTPPLRSSSCDPTNQEQSPIYLHKLQTRAALDPSRNTGRCRLCEARRAGLPPVSACG